MFYYYYATNLIPESEAITGILVGIVAFYYYVTYYEAISQKINMLNYLFTTGILMVAPDKESLPELEINGSVAKIPISHKGTLYYVYLPYNEENQKKFFFVDRFGKRRETKNFPGLDFYCKAENFANTVKIE